MTRKDYILITQVLQQSYTGVASKEMARGVEYVMHSLFIALKRDNPRFNREHFLAVVRGEKDLNSKPSRTNDLSEEPQRKK